MSRIHMIRHGRPASTWGDADLDPGLDAVGAEQARAVTEALLALPVPERPTRVVSSPLRRCRETAQPLADALGVALEIDARVGEIPTPAALAPDDRPAWLRQAFEGRWSDIRGDLDYGAWTRDVAQGVASHPGAAVFSHFVALNAAVSVATGGQQVAAFRPDHVSVTVFDLVDSGLILVEKGREASTQVL
ncbi:phosphoglycerate kinase [Caulobacter sp. Root655]|uniref:histidine phosphatase family protein n=1 Tax=Caulobacter sp. Root655 TaxID=1736578 RepID=UPI0006F74168|nr:histidine phosphatase family protein [Caulobacter sp. Root655]KRA65072.1 phosphoglycerate kinase [Caulobacter sp. Root655]